MLSCFSLGHISLILLSNNVTGYSTKRVSQADADSRQHL